MKMNIFRLVLILPLLLLLLLFGGDHLNLATASKDDDGITPPAEGKKHFFHSTDHDHRPARLKINFTAITLPNNNEEESNFTFHWKPDQFPLVPNLSLKFNRFDPLLSDWTEQTLARNITNNGSVSLIVKRADFEQKMAHSLFLFSLEPADTTQSTTTRRFKRGFGTFLLSLVLDAYNFYSEHISGNDCQSWYRTDPGPPTDLTPCPPNVTLYRADYRFELDGACESPPCEFHPGADFCTRSRQPSLSGGGQQCCYKDEQLLLGPPGGGTVDRSHYSNGFLKWNHFNDDVLPWALCCKDKPLWMCELYYERRPSDPGTGYEPPGGWPTTTTTTTTTSITTSKPPSSDPGETPSEMTQSAPRQEEASNSGTSYVPPADGGWPTTSTTTSKPSSSDLGETPSEMTRSAPRQEEEEEEVSNSGTLIMALTVLAGAILIVTSTIFGFIIWRNVSKRQNSGVRKQLLENQQQNGASIQGSSYQAIQT